ncbi:N-acetylmannosamine-6-phosphate 2-epimerase [Alicyclobacillus curvatus]|nr:N-acetylmannosamine-6-phosphate 2-epimerase [Alicyclobacillus curvatus]
MAQLLEKLRTGLIVSCQAGDDEPLHGSDIMGRMAVAAKLGGAVGIRANGGSDIQKVKELTGLPVIGIVKREYPNSGVYITPTLKEVEEVVRAGADIIAFDATDRPRPNGQRASDFLVSVKEHFPDVYVMADISTFEEGVRAAKSGADVVATTLSGYTTYSAQLLGPDFELMEQLTKALTVPVIAEGRVHTPEDAVQCFTTGVWAVVVGSAITRPQEITQRFVERVAELFRQQQSLGR